MNAFCPECETELDQATGICPACRWDPYSAATRTNATSQTGSSISERYRGTPYDASWDGAVVHHSSSGISRGRVIVIAGLLAVVGFYGIILGMLGAH
ncbi:hypothetical protein BH24CHL9_BH24CHL9_05810 [soil metagenome]